MKLLIRFPPGSPGAGEAPGPSSRSATVTPLVGSTTAFSWGQCERRDEQRVVSLLLDPAQTCFQK